MADYPTLGQAAPDYWADELKTYIDEGDADSGAGKQDAATLEEDVADKVGTGGPLDEANKAKADNDAIKKARALRAWYVAQGTADATAVDILFTTGDSITEGAYATGTGAWEKRYVGVFNDMIRRALQPSGISGGSSYYGFGSNLILSGAGFIGGTGTITQDFTRGLGLKSYTLANGAVFSYYFIGDAADLLYSTDPSFGSIAITVDGVSAGTVNQAVTASSGNKKRLTGVGNGAHTVVVTSTGTTNLEGSKSYNGDTTAGYRVWEAGHSGYGAHDFQTQTRWADSVPAIPNVKLVVMSGNSNDYYAGRTKAQCKTDTLANIALLRTKISGEFSIVLLSYYDRPPGGAVAPWQDFVDMYQEIADADPLVYHLDLDPVFGHKTSNTDDRGGLVNNTDYVHPTNAGHKIIGKYVADAVIPEGQAGGGLFENIPSASLPVSTPQAAADLAASAGLPYTAIGNFAGAMSFSALPIGNFSLTATGNLTLPLSGMPAVTAGRTARFFVRILQDGTGGRTFTPDALMKRVGTFAIDLTATTGLALIEFFYDGISWWVFNRSDPAVGVTETAAIAAVTGDQQPVYSASFAGGAIVLSSFLASTYAGYRLVLGGAVSFSAAAKPVIAAGRAFSFFIVFVQDATGSRVMTWNANVLYAGTKPVLSTAANAIDIGFFEWTGTELILVNFQKGVA